MKKMAALFRCQEYILKLIYVYKVFYIALKLVMISSIDMAIIMPVGGLWIMVDQPQFKVWFASTVHLRLRD